MKPHVLVFTNRYECNADIIVPMLQKRGVSVVRINTEQFPSEIQLSLILQNNSFSFDVFGSTHILSDEVRSCWYRQPWCPEISAIQSPGYEHLIQEESKLATWSFMTMLDVFWMNHPSVTYLLNSNKMLQMQYAQMVGLKTPDTLITNDSNALTHFCDTHQGSSFAIKLMSGKVFHSKNPNVVGCVYTHKLSFQDIKARLNRISICPVFIQEYIEKKIELRITVVGDSVFSCAIHSQNSQKTLHDWRRYDFPNVKHETVSLPDSIHNKLLTFMKLSRLSFGAFDFIVTPQDEYVFLEVNPGGQWGWIEELTNLPISDAIVEMLVNPPNS